MAVVKKSQSRGRAVANMKKIILSILKLYQKIISPIFVGLGIRCRFYPTCSEYAVLAVQKYGIIKAVYLSCLRVLKCNPWQTGGVDLP